jgi:hypothetical protein
MLAIVGMVSLTSGTCLACGGTRTRYEAQLDLLAGLLVIAGLAAIGALLPIRC